MESVTRMKTVSWRILASGTMLLLTRWTTGSWVSSLDITIPIVIATTIEYYLHERFYRWFQRVKNIQ